MCIALGLHARTLVAYYSYTGNIETIVSELKKQIDCDVLRIEPQEKGLKYEANTYAIGSEQLNKINAAPNDLNSYPAIDPITVNLSDYDCFIIATPLWWSQMATPMQSFLFQHGSEMAGKPVGLIVSSASSGISGVEKDCKRLVPNGNYFSSSLWIRYSQVSNAASLIAAWLQEIQYSNTTALDEVSKHSIDKVPAYTLAGQPATDGYKGIVVQQGKKIIKR